MAAPSDLNRREVNREYTLREIEDSSLPHAYRLSLHHLNTEPTITLAIVLGNLVEKHGMAKFQAIPTRFRNEKGWTTMPEEYLIYAIG